MFKSVCPAGRISEGGGERERLHDLLYYPRKSPEQNGINHSHRTKTKTETSTAKMIPAPDNKFENISHHVI